jgi:ABC-type phosphate/phosphonate transport system ATPase subunit
MSKTDFIRPNALGDLRAEADDKMLSRAFLETADYRTLIETSDRTVVVGRRGTGKSALTVSLQRHWRGAGDTHVVKIAPEEHQTIGVRDLRTKTLPKQ